MKKTKKILISVLTAGCLASAAFGLAACGGGDGTGETPATPSGDYVVYTVTFDTNGGTLLPEQGAEAGDKAVKPGDPKKAGYTFGGWYANAACTQQYDFNSGITGNTTIYAKWDAAPTTDAEYFRLTQDGEGWSVAAMPGKNMPVDVVIPATIDDKTITSVAVSGFEDVENIQSVTLPDTVTTIGQRAFRGCSDLEVILGGANVEMIDSDAFDDTAWDNSLPAGEVYLGKTLYKYASSIFVETAVEVKEGTVGIASGAFLNQPNLVGVTLPDSLKYIGSYAFGADSAENGNGVAEVVIPDSVVEIGANAFRYAPIETLIIGKGVDYIGAKAFAGTDITYLEFNAANGVIADATFDGLTSPATVKIANEVKTFPENLVKGWNGIVSLDLGTGITVIPAGVLDGHTALAELKFGNLVRIGGNAFRGIGITELTLPVTLDHLGNSAFENCKNLQTVTINAESVGVSGSTFPAFKGCDKLSTVNFGSTVREIPDYLFYENVYVTSLGFEQGVERIGMYAFYGTSVSGKLVLPEGLTYIGDHAFDIGTDEANTNFGSTPIANLQNLVIPSTLEEIGSEAFANNRSLTYLAWNAVDAKASVYTPRDAWNPNVFAAIFTGCKELKYVNIGSSVRSLPEQFIKGATKVEEVDVKSVRTLGAQAFDGCTSLVSLGESDGANITTLGADALRGTPYLQIVLDEYDGNPYYIGEILMGFSGTMPESYTLTIAANRTASIADGAFRGQTNLTAISINNNSSILTAIGASAFEGCTGLTTFSTGGSQSKIETIGNRAFYGCTNLASVTLTGVVTIGESAFERCTNLYKTRDGTLTIPATTVTIGARAFYNMSLTGGTLTVENNSALKEIGDEAFYNAYPNAINIGACERVGNAWIGEGGALMGCDFTATGLKYVGNYGLDGVSGDFDFSTIIELGDYALLGAEATDYVFDNVTKIGVGLFGTWTSNKGGQGSRYVQNVTFKAPLEEIPQDAFAGTKSLKSVTLEHPEALKTVGDHAFADSTLETIDISHVTSFGQYAFSKTNLKLENFTFSEDVEKIGNYAFNVCNDITGTLTIRGKLTEIPQSAFLNVPYTKLIIGGSVQTIGATAFRYNVSERRNNEVSPNPVVSEVILENGVVSIDSSAFSSRVGDVISIPATVTHIGQPSVFSVVKLGGYFEPTDLATNTFSSTAILLCDSEETLAQLKVSAVWTNYRDRAFGPSAVIEDDWVIDETGKIQKYLGDKTNISIPAEAKSMDSISAILGTRAADLTAESITITAAAGSGFKYENDTLSSQDGTVLYFYNGTGTSVENTAATSVGAYAFYGKTALQSVTLSNVTTIGANAFQNCTALTTFTGANVVTVSDNGFQHCDVLATFDFGKLETVGTSAFAYCAFTEVNLPKIKTLGASGFRYIGELTSVTIGADCTSLAAYAFAGGATNFTVTVNAATPPTGAMQMFGTAAAFQGTIYVPTDSVAAYQAATQWSTYSTKIQAIVAD